MKWLAQVAVGLAMGLAIVGAVFFLGCESKPFTAQSQRARDLRINEHGGYDGEPRSAALSCAPGFILASEMGRHSAKIWCEPVDGGAR